MYTIYVKDKFSSAHNLRGYGGQCENLHGHTWRVEVGLKGKELNKIGFLKDFKDVKQELKELTDKLDHAYINEIPPFDKINPTAENISKYIFDSLKSKFPEVFEVCVWESDNARAVYSPE